MSEDVWGIFWGRMHSLLLEQVLLYESYRCFDIYIDPKEVYKNNMQIIVKLVKNLISYLSYQNIHIIKWDDISQKKNNLQKTKGFNIKM